MNIVSSEKRALPCPFCGKAPTTEYWHGGGAGKRNVGCINDRCHVQPSVTGNNVGVATRRWNTRHTVSPTLIEADLPPTQEPPDRPHPHDHDYVAPERDSDDCEGGGDGPED